MTEIKINPDAMQALVLKAILDSFDEETRNQLITDAIADLLKKSGRYNDSAPIEGIVRNAVYQASEKAVRQMVEESSEIQARITEVATPILDTVLAAGTEGLNIDERVVEALVAEIRKRRGY